MGRCASGSVAAQLSTRPRRHGTGQFPLGRPEPSRADPAEWTDAKLTERAKTIQSDKGPEGNFED